MQCPSCGVPMAAEARFCQRCGSKAPESPSSGAPDPLRDVLRLALGRQYEINRLLGKGGMGAVYLAREAALERDVAIKVLPPDRGATQESRDRFRREARTAAKLSHPNIVPLYTFGDVDGTLYFVMGYVKGESLATRLKREGKLPVEESRRILIEVAEALDYAHKLGIVHRDIKPDNVLIEEATGRAMLTDFGIAKAVGAGQTMTTAGSVLGTPHYMSPEQAQGKADIDARSDLYSLGVMGYAMLSGRLPFEGATPGDVMVQHITKEPPPLATLASDVPPEIATALTRCLMKNPNGRWPDATRLKNALARKDVETTPEEFEGLSDQFRTMVGAVFVLLILGVWWLGGGDVSDPFPALPLVVGTGACLIALLLTIRFGRLRKARFTTMRILNEILKQPEAWPGWYPRPFRAYGDVWDRLPLRLRQARAAVGWAFAVLSFSSLPMLVFSQALNSYVIRNGRYPYGSRPDPDPVFYGVILPTLAVTVFLVARWQKLARSAGLDSRAMNGALLSPTTSAANEAGSAEPASAVGFALAVGSIANALPEASRAIGAKAHAGARELADSIDALDKQLSHLAGAFAPEDGKRLGERIAALGEDAGPADENREIRDILLKQLDAVRNLESRIEDIKARRAKRFELLRSLWLHAIELQAAANDPTKTGDTTDRIHKLFAQIEEHTRGQRPSATDGGPTNPFSELPTLER